MPDQDGPTPIRPDANLAGAVDLAAPIQNAGRAFLTTMAQQQGKAVVMIGITAENQVMAVNYTPGGMVEALGLTLLGALTLWHGQQHNRSPKEA